MKILILLFLLFSAGCTTFNPNKWHDERASSVCGVIEGKVSSSLYATGDYGGCKVVCSENAPKNFKLKYRSNFCEIDIGDK